MSVLLGKNLGSIQFPRAKAFTKGKKNIFFLPNLGTRDFFPVVRNPKHQICFPVVGACAKEITFHVAHMKTEKAFNEVFMLALSKGQSFGTV